MNLLTVGRDDLQVMAQFGHVGTTALGPYSWASDATGVATVTPVGDGLTAMVHAVAPGTAVITLTAGSLSSTFTVKVVANPAAVVRIVPLSLTGQKYPNDAGSGGGQQPNPNPN